MYAEIIDNAVVRTYAMLPEGYRNISNFNALSNEQLQDLSWAGITDAKFYPYNPANPPANTCCYDVEYVIDNDNKVVNSNIIINEVPATSASAVQLRLAFIQNNISLSVIENALDNISDPILKEQMRVVWEYEIVLYKDHQLISILAQALSLSSEQIDNIFNQASKL